MAYLQGRSWLEPIRADIGQEVGYTPTLKGATLSHSHSHLTLTFGKFKDTSWPINHTHSTQKGLSLLLGDSTNHYAAKLTLKTNYLIMAEWCHNIIPAHSSYMPI